MIPTAWFVCTQSITGAAFKRMYTLPGFCVGGGIPHFPLDFWRKLSAIPAGVELLLHWTYFVCYVCSEASSSHTGANMWSDRFSWFRGKHFPSSSRRSLSAWLSSPARLKKRDFLCLQRLSSTPWVRFEVSAERMLDSVAVPHFYPWLHCRHNIRIKLEDFRHDDGWIQMYPWRYICMERSKELPDSPGWARRRRRRWWGDSGSTFTPSMVEILAAWKEILQLCKVSLQ